MSVNEFFEKYSIETINKRTRISPVSLTYIKNKDFDKITKVKFIGFVRIIEKEFKVDLSELIEEYDNVISNVEKKQQSNVVVFEEPKKYNTLTLFVLALILFGIGAYFLYNKYNLKKSENMNEINKTSYLLNEKNNEENDTYYSFENNITKNEENITTVMSNESNDTNYTISINENNETNITKVDANISNVPMKIKITTNNKLWFMAKNLDTNETHEYLIKEYKILKGANWYMKLGHGNITINYGNQTINIPQTKKILRILFKNGKIEYLTKPNRYEK